MLAWLALDLVLWFRSPAMIENGVHAQGDSPHAFSPDMSLMSDLSSDLACALKVSLGYHDVHVM